MTTTAAPATLPTAAHPSPSTPTSADGWPVWVTDRLWVGEDATVGALDHGLIVGDGVFETLKVTAGVPFALTMHLRRLARSAAGMGLPPVDEPLVREAVAAVLSAAAAAAPSPTAASASPGAPTRARLRITWTPGRGPLGSERPALDHPTLVVAASPALASPATTRAVTVPWTRNERGATAGLKTTSYGENVIALGVARERGATEAVMANTRGEVCEGTGSNVVVRVGDELLTPPLSSGCLAGTTRALLLVAAAQAGLTVREADIPWQDLATADEVLLTSSLRDVQHVEALDDRPLVLGDLSRAAVAAFADLAARDDDPLPEGW